MLDVWQYNARCLREIGCAGIVLTLLITSGCGGGSKREYATIAGTVSIGDEPIPGGRVIFDHVEGPIASANIDEEGNYKARVVVGLQKIAIDYHDDPDEKEVGGSVTGIRTEEIVPGKSLVPKKYTASKTSGLEFEVLSGENIYDIRLNNK
ncbi:hypothetical protein [Schlesneria sp. DSM 10557]|uniref:hypothetical protein n=1 Tax=Schlesneria sp. DSM 10557 TaxID=3044399 RepID=UPI00359F4BF8